MECGAAEATGLGFVCFVVINPRMLSANRVDFGHFVEIIQFYLYPPPPRATCLGPRQCVLPNSQKPPNYREVA